MSKILTVITSLFNDRNGLEQTLEASAAFPESWRSRVTHLVADGNSRDAPVEIVARYRDRLDIRFIAGFDRGIYHAWNKAVSATSTPFLTFIGAGDRMTECGWQPLLAKLTNEANAWDLLLGKARFIYPSGRIEIHGQPFDRESFSRFFSIVHPGAVYRRDVFERFGNFDERFRITGDYEFITRLAPHVRFEFLDEVLADFPIDGISSASFAPLKEAFSVRKKHRTVTNASNRMLYARAVLAHLRTRWTK